MIDTGKTGEFRYQVPQQPVTQDSIEFGITPSQTVGPYVHIGLTRDGSNIMVDENGVQITFTVIDGGGDPIADAMIELWQPGPDGTFNTQSAEGFRGLGRGFANAAGNVSFTTLIPGGYEDEAPHINVGVFARGMLERLYTRMYFPENADANATDPVLEAVDDTRRDLLIAEKTDAGYHMTIRVQHPDADKETPFFGL